MTTHNARKNESGNAFIMILIGVVLFAALAFTFTRGAQQGGESISSRQLELAASDIISFSQRTSRAVDTMLRNGISETQIDFAGLKDAYANTACTADNCKVFVTGGGAVDLRYPLDNWIDNSFSSSYAYGDWYVTAQFCVPGVPDNTCSPPRGNDLVLILPYITQSLCEKIDEKLNIANAPVPSPSTFGTIAAAAQFDGSFSPAGGANLWDAAALNNNAAGCLRDPATHAYVYYQVLISR